MLANSKIDKSHLILLIIISFSQLLTLNFFIDVNPGFWPKIVSPTLIALGIIGKLLSIKFTSALGWSGVSLFFVAGLVASLPNPDYENPMIINHIWFDIRYFAIFAFSLLWGWSYWNLRSV